MNQVGEIIHLFFQVDKAIQEQLRDSGTTCPLSLPEFIALSYIERVKTASISEMAVDFGIRKASVSTKITNFERRGLIHREGCKFDKRSHTISLTEKARSLLNETKDYVGRHASPLLNKLTDTEQTHMITLLNKLVN